MKQKKGRGKSKGSGFERAVSKLFDTWWEVPKNTFWRTVNSGGWKEPGDIAPRFRSHEEKIWWPFIVECKFYKNFSINDVLLGKKTGHLLKWWSQVTKEQLDALLALNRPSLLNVRLLICKYNHGPIFVGISSEDIPDIEFACIPKVDIKVREVNFTLFRWQDFSKIYNQAIFKKIFDKL